MSQNPRSLKILGVMTGTSCDGLDAACIDIDGEGWQPLWDANTPFPAALRKRVLAAQKPGFKQGIQNWLELNRDLGLWYAVSLKKLITKFGVDAAMKPQVIANHGQTIAHLPSARLTLQLGDPTLIAAATGLTVASCFREGDMAAGGQGAPLVPLFHRLLAHALGEASLGVAIHNIGGISNLTYIGPNGDILAFDTGPGGLWIDSAAELATQGRLKMDKGGRLAAKGRIDEDAVIRVLRHHYFKKAAPKSTSRDEFPFELLRSHTQAKGADLVATATAVTVESLAQAYEKTVLSKGRPLNAIYFCGGGANNPILMGWLQDRLGKVEVRRLTDAGFDGQLVEAQAFAFFGYLALMGSPLGGSWTGAKSFGPPAHIIPGENWAELLPTLHEIQSRN